MSRRNVEFYATAEEQRSWLLELALDHDLWFIVDEFPSSPTVIVSADTLRQMSFDRSEPLQIFVGRKDLGPGPTWRIAGERKELDFKSSQAIQLVPSRTQRGVLTEGRIAIMRRQEYESAGIPFEPLYSWFRELCSELKEKLHATEMRLMTHSSTEPPARSRRSVLVSPGAIAWRRSGQRLQQVAGSAIEFDIPSEVMQQ